MKIHNLYAALGSEFGTQIEPTPLTDPTLVCINQPLAKILGVDPSVESFSSIFGGTQSLPGSKPFAMVYSGHQFGGYSPQLGDGRGVLIGEIETPQGLKDIHLKGAGLTPYSRFGDGKAVLRSCIREYLGSVALEGLNIPTTQALCVVKGRGDVEREQLEPEAMLTRVAKTHIRFGSFEYFHHTNQTHLLTSLADYAIRQCIPSETGKEDSYEKLFEHAVITTAQLIAKWQAVGFCHGVLNTDNMSIAGETLDFGPYGFLEKFNMHHICNHSDHSGRYAFDQQPSIGLWNLNALATAFTTLVPQNKLEKIIQLYEPTLVKTYTHEMKSKLGLADSGNTNQLENNLLNDLFRLMQKYSPDYTFFFRALSHLTHSNWMDNILEVVSHSNSSDECREEFSSWLNNYKGLLDTNIPLENIEEVMLQKNPKYILRNYLAQRVIEEAQHGGSQQELNNLIEALTSPYDELHHLSYLAEKPPEWAKKLSVSCSS